MDEDDAARAVLGELKQSGLGLPSCAAVSASVLLAIILEGRPVGTRLDVFDAIVARLRKTLAEIDREQMQ